MLVGLINEGSLPDQLCKYRPHQLLETGDLQYRCLSRGPKPTIGGNEERKSVAMLRRLSSTLFILLFPPKR